jgi:Trypsin-co-occurring domain 2
LKSPLTTIVTWPAGFAAGGLVRYLDVRRLPMSGGDVGSVEGLGLADAIGLLRDELLRARAAGATSEIQLPVESMTVELTVTATRSVDGRAGFKVPFVQFELGGGGSRQRGSEQLVTVVFGGPVDRQGRPVKVAQATDELKG